jgi:MSHA biogenesis protein MshN
MSVINQMLRDLDARHASEQERAGLPAGLRTLPPRQVARSGEWRTLALGMLAGAAIAGVAAAWYVTTMESPAVATPQPPARPTPPVPPAPTGPANPMQAPATVSPAPSSSSAPAGPAATATPQRVESGDMKLSTLFHDGKAESPATAPAEAAPVPTAVVAPPTALPAPATNTSSAKPTPPAKAAPAAKSDAATKAESPAKAEGAAVTAKAVTAPAERRKESGATRTAPEPVKQVATESAKPSVEPAKPPSARETKVSAAPSTADAQKGEAQIDKRAKGGQAHEFADAEYRKGIQAVKRGDNGTALGLFKRSLELDPGYAKARQAMLSVLVGGRQWAEARQTAQEGLALDPTQSGWATILARLQFEQGDVAAALETLGKYEAHASADPDYHGLYAYLLQKQQRPAEAAQRFRTALALRPSEGRWWFGLGLALESAGQGNEAKEAYAKAREVGHLPGDMLTVIEQKLK